MNISTLVGRRCITETTIPQSPSKLLRSGHRKDRTNVSGAVKIPSYKRIRCDIRERSLDTFSQMPQG
ncbi:hypothetical protein [Sphingobacterium sp. JB170]|uniref:hypothetical protein n=1 Tax=Sphingobacterium sp. JB170 TaxID=1434842 RepID=UPI00211AC2CA|nr:hypothetical protein [Sphingobacterium sp. JB170]